MLDEIESALYAEDPKFVSTVAKQRVGRPGARRRLQAALLILVGLALLVGGIMVDVEVAGLKIISVVGFLVMFGGGLLLILGPRDGAGGAPVKSKGRGGGKPSSGGSLSARMEERFNRRFDQDGR